MSENSLYNLYFAFMRHPSRYISSEQYTTRKTEDGLEVKFRHTGEFNIIDVRGFDSEASAQKFANQMWLGCIFTLLEEEIPFDINIRSTVQNVGRDAGTTFFVQKSDFPYRNDKNLGNAIILKDKDFPEIGSMKGKSATTTDFEKLVPLFLDYASTERFEIIQSQENLKLALELYNAHFFEQSTSARFLTLVMALEILADKKYRPQVALDIIGDWEQQLRTYTKDDSLDDNDKEALKSLLNSFVHLKRNSIRSSLVDMVVESFSSFVTNDSLARMVKEIKKLYDYRSTLVHNGTVEKVLLKQYEISAASILRQILRQKVRQVIEYT